MKIQEVLSSLSLKDAGIYSRDGTFKTDIRIVKSNSSKGTHWVCFINENYCDSFGCAPPKKPSKLIIKRNGHCYIQSTK